MYVHAHSVECSHAAQVGHVVGNQGQVSEVHLDMVHFEHPVDFVDDGQSACLYTIERDDLVYVIALYFVVVDIIGFIPLVITFNII